MYWWTSTCCVFQEMPVHTKVWSSKTHIPSLLVLHIVCMIYSRTAVVCRDLFHLVSFSSQHKMQAPDKPGGWRSRKTGNYDRVKEKWKVARKEILKEVWKREREKRCSEKGWRTGRFCHRQWYCGTVWVIMCLMPQQGDQEGIFISVNKWRATFWKFIHVLA